LGDRLSDGAGKLANTPMKVLYKNSECKDEAPSKNVFNEIFRISNNPKTKKEIDSILHDISFIKDYMKYNLNPSHISEKISTMIRYREGKKQRNTITILAGLGMFLLIAAIAFYIISGQLKCPSCPSFAQVCSIAANNTRRVISGSII